MFDFDTPVERRGSASVKWDKYPGRDVIPMWVADMDFRSPPAVIEALQRRVAHGVFGYSHAPEELTAAILAHLWTDFGWKVAPDWLVWLPGLVTGLNVACRAVGEDGDQVLTTVPVYPPFLSAPGHFHRDLVTVPLTQRDGRWELDPERLEAAITPRTRLLLLCSPHNPVGRVFSHQELAALATICARHDLILCSDEIHAGLVLDTDKAHLPSAALDPELARRTITLMAPSKTFNIPGLGFSFAVIPDVALRRRFVDAMAGIVPYVNALGYTAALAAYRDGGPWQAALLAVLRANRDGVEQAVAAMPGLTMAHVEATYLAWIDTRPAGLETPVKFFEQAGVGLSDGRDFAAPGFVRLNFGCPRATLDKALRRMAQALQHPARQV